jgi:glycine dehydrogenase subunit 2
MSVYDRATTGLIMNEPPIFERSRPGRTGFSLPPEPEGADEALAALPPRFVRASPPGLPEVSEVDVIRHFTRLSQWNYAIDLGTYPLGSCTMKYNPRINEAAARIPGFANGHPYQPDEWLQGSFALMADLEDYLAEIAGLSAVTLQPAAGAQGEFTGLRLIRQGLIQRDGTPRKSVLIPDSAHGTNPATCAMNGYKVVQLDSDARGLVDPEVVARAMSEDVAGLMVTNPNTLGLFEQEIGRICEIVHAKGGMVYCDGANMNSVLGRARPGDSGVDVMHFNLHKTFSTPHGGGGPGAGPVAVAAHLEPYLPAPRIRRLLLDDGTRRFELDHDRPLTIGRVKAFFGNFGMLVRAYTYIREYGGDGLKQVTDMAVLNANYMLALLRPHYHVEHDRLCMHECILTDKRLHKHGVKTMDVAKRLMDYGFHPPTVYFPICVPGALMIEPTETESKDELDELADAFIAIAREAETNPELLHDAPTRAKIGRVDEALAARRPILRWSPSAPPSD